MEVLREVGRASAEEVVEAEVEVPHRLHLEEGVLAGVVLRR